MSINVYLDHNIVDDISKGKLFLNPSGKVVWVYSNENFAEIRRSGSTRFLAVLEKIKAKKLELVLDENFRITGKAEILNYRSPHKEYESYLEAVTENEVVSDSDMEFLARLSGADNKIEVLSHPNSFEESVRSLLEPYGLYGGEIKSEVERVRDELTEIVKGPLQEVGELENTRMALGTNNGRAGNLATKENPIEELWEIVKKTAPEMTSDQYFGFDPADKQGYEKWPMYLGVVGCHTMLNFLGFRPDGGLNKPKDLPGILSDGSHIAYGAYCQALLSGDRKLRSKARAIYRYKNIGTQVLRIERKNC